MIEVTLVNILAVLLAYFSRNKHFKYCFELAILILICFYGVRYKYGNDFSSYLAIFNQVNSYVQLDTALRNASYSNLEIGWVLLNRLFGNLGFSALVFFLTIVQFSAIYYISVKYVQRKDLYIVLFFYLFTSTFLLTMLSAMRQCLAISIVLFSVPLILRGKKIFAILVIILAAQFHSSAYIMILLPFLPILCNLRKETYIAIMSSIIIFFFIGQGLLGEQMSIIVQKHFQRYDTYLDDTYTLGWQRVLLLIWDMVFFYCILLNDPHDKSNYSFFMKSFSILYLISPLKLIAPLILRLGFYFGNVGVVSLAILYKKNNKSTILKVVLTINILYTLFRYFEFFYNPTWTRYYLHYNTIFS